MAADLVGGQALVEGVMVRRGDRWGAAARRADGSIATTLQTARLALPRTRRVPVLRGVGALIDSVRIGLSAMEWSRRESAESGTSTAPTARERAVVGLVVTGVVSVFLFVPVVAAAAAAPLIGRGVAASVAEGLVRLALFVGYLWLLSGLPGIRRTLEYHGAEHMVIAAYEHGAMPTIDQARCHSPRHPRCGTDFFLLIFAVSIVVFAAVGALPAVWLLISRVALAPVTVGISYEILRIGGGHGHGVLARSMAAPGLFLQRFTTRLPDDAQIEVARAALMALVAVDAEGADVLGAPDADLVAPRG